MPNLLFQNKYKTYIRGIIDEIFQENVFVIIERVDNYIHEPRNLSSKFRLLGWIMKSLLDIDLDSCSKSSIMYVFPIKLSSNFMMIP